MHAVKTPRSATWQVRASAPLTTVCATPRGVVLPSPRPQEQGFVTGLYTDPNGSAQGTEGEQLNRLLTAGDQIRVGLAGNLADYTFESATGETVSGADIPYGDAPAGYTQDPQENIVYVSAHDNETLFDAVALKAPLETPMRERVRMQNLGLSLVALSQGVPFFHAGSDLLRSKSLDRNSYNSGDWFNKLDFSYQTNNWGVGLPPGGENEDNWPLMSRLLGTLPAPTETDIRRSVRHLQDMLTIRDSSPLFRLPTAEAVQNQLSFHNTGLRQVPGVIVMHLAPEPSAAADTRTPISRSSLTARLRPSGVKCPGTGGQLSPPPGAADGQRSTCQVRTGAGGRHADRTGTDHGGFCRRIA